MGRPAQKAQAEHLAAPGKLQLVPNQMETQNITVMESTTMMEGVGIVTEDRGTPDVS